jgi:hypothetical protein
MGGGVCAQGFRFFWVMGQSKQPIAKSKKNYHNRYSSSCKSFEAKNGDEPNKDMHENYTQPTR